MNRPLVIRIEKPTAFLATAQGRFSRSVSRLGRLGVSAKSGRLQLSVGRAFGFLPPRNHVISFEELSGLSLRFEPDAPLPLELHIERAGVAFPPIRFAVDNLDRAEEAEDFFRRMVRPLCVPRPAQQAPTDYRRRIAPTAQGRPWMGYGVRLVNETDTVIRLVDEPSDEVEVVKPFEPMAEADYEELTASEAHEDEAHAPLVDFDRWSPLAEMPFRLIGVLLGWSALLVAPFMALFVCFFSPYLIAGSSTPLRFIVLCFLVGPPVMLVLFSMPGLLPDRLSDEPRYLARLFRWKAFVVSWTGAWTLFYAGEWHPLPPHVIEKAVFGLGLFVGVTLLLAWLGGALSKRAFESEEPIVSMPWGMILGPAFLALVSVWMLGASSPVIPAIPWVRPPATQLPPALPMESLEEGAHAQADRALMLLRVEPPVTERNDAAVSGHRFDQVWSAAERFLNAYVFKEGRKAPSSEVGTFVFTNARQRLIRLLRSCRAVEPICNAEAQWCRCDARVGAKDGWVRFERDDRRRWRIEWSLP